MPGPRHLHDDLAGGRLGVRDLGQPHHLRPAEFLDLDRLHLELIAQECTER